MKNLAQTMYTVKRKVSYVCLSHCPSVRPCTDRPPTWSADTVDCTKCVEGNRSNNVKGDRKCLGCTFGDDRPEVGDPERRADVARKHIRTHGGLYICHTPQPAKLVARKRL